VWNYWVNNYLMGNPPPAFDILAWNEDKTNLPAALHRQFLDMFEDNVLTVPGGVEVLGHGVDLAAVKADAYVIGGFSDHLTPWQGCYQSTQFARRQLRVRVVPDRPHPDPGVPARAKGAFLHRTQARPGPGSVAVGGDQADR